MTQYTRNTTPMQEANRRRWDRVKTAKAVDTLVALGWQRTVTEHGLTLTEPSQPGSVKTEPNT